MAICESQGWRARVRELLASPSFHYGGQIGEMDGAPRSLASTQRRDYRTHTSTSSPVTVFLTAKYLSGAKVGGVGGRERSSP